MNCWKRIWTRGKNEPEKNHAHPIEKKYIIMTTTYDQIPYKSAAICLTHPNRLAAIAMLFGMEPVDVKTSRILELGCGEGLNLIAMAYGLPQSELVGVDLAGSAIGCGQNMINSLGLKNITLIHKDITELSDDMGEFDYIIAHGVFSWVPRAAQEKILGICKNHLTPQGVAFISYNAYPGWHLHEMSRKIMRFHSDQFSDPKQKAVQALAVLKFIAESAFPKTGAYKHFLMDEVEELEKTAPDMYYNCLIHDRVGEINYPVYFWEFMERAEMYDLKYLAEAEFSEMQDLYYPPETREMLNKIAGDNILVKEQFSDFLKGRRFRQTLLCHKNLSLNRTLHPKIMENFWFSCPSKPVDENGEISKQGFLKLATRTGVKLNRGGSTMSTNNDVVHAALLFLSDIWPMPLHFNDLLAVGQKFGNRASEKDRIELRDTLLRALSGNIVEVHIDPPRFAREPGEYPTASELVRHQLQTGSNVTSLCHLSIKLEGTYGMFILPLSDGTRSRQTICDEVLNIITSCNISLNGKHASEKTKEQLMAEIDQEFMNCAKYGLLLG